MNNIIEINDITAPELDVYARTSEVQLLRYYEPEPGLFIAESPKVIERALNAGYEPLSFLVEHKDLEAEAKQILERYPEIPVYTAEYDVLVGMTGYALARGMLCAMKRRRLPSVEGICQNTSRIAILENVVNPTNIGDFPQCGSTSYGRCSFDRRMQQSTLSKSGPRKHGNDIPDSVDIF